MNKYKVVDFHGNETVLNADYFLVTGDSYTNFYRKLKNHRQEEIIELIAAFKQPVSIMIVEEE